MTPPLPGVPQVDKLKEFSRPVKGSDDIKNVAAISSGNDEVIGQMIADALEKVGGRPATGFRGKVERGEKVGRGGGRVGTR